MLRKTLVVVILFLGGILIFTKDLKFSAPHSAPRLGHIETTKGLVLAKSENNDNFVNLAEKAAVIGPLQIVTGFESEVSLNFGENFKILENSSVQLYKRANRFFVEIIRGSVQRSHPDANVAFQVDGKEKRGLMISAPQNQSLATIKPIENVAQEGGLKASPPDEFQIVLSETLKLHQRFFEKCFIKLYEKQNGNLVAGQVESRFQIDRRGYVNAVSLLKSDYDDQDFKACVEEVISRVQFKGYKDSPRTVDFPIQFNLPN